MSPLAVCPSSVSSSRLAKPKSVILGVPSCGQQHVRGFQVAVDDAGLVSGAHWRGPASPPTCAACWGGSGVPSSFCAKLPPSTNSSEKLGVAVVFADGAARHDVGVL